MTALGLMVPGVSVLQVELEPRDFKDLLEILEQVEFQARPEQLEQSVRLESVALMDRWEDLVKLVSKAQ